MTTKERNWVEDLDGLYQMPGHLLRRANQAVVARFNECCQDMNITPVQFAAMTAIAAEDALDVTRLSLMIGFDRATLGGVVDRLEQRGYLVRTPHTTDRRIKVVSLTKIGKDALARARPRVESSQEDFISVLTADERTQFKQLLKKLLQASE